VTSSAEREGENVIQKNEVKKGNRTVAEMLTLTECGPDCITTCIYDIFSSTAYH
jgi:hypothetical protein